MSVNYFGHRSKRELLTMHVELQLICQRAIKIVDFAVICGYRDEEAQNLLYKLGRSRLKYPDSAHNTMVDGVPCSNAMDLAFRPVEWNNIKKWHYFGGIIMGVAGALDIDLRWGGDWDRDFNLTNQTFFDYGHFERVTERR